MHLVKTFISGSTSLFLTSLIDWIFSGIVLDKIYKKNPEIWRNNPQNRDESIQIITSIGLTLLSCFGLVLLVNLLDLEGNKLVIVTFLLWLSFPLPIYFIMSTWINMTPIISLVNSLGWLVKLVIIDAVILVTNSLFRV